MIVRDYGEAVPEPVRRWYLVAVTYPSAKQAKAAWEEAERKLIRGSDHGIGVMRLLPPGSNPGGMVDSGAPEGGHPVIAVTTEFHYVEKIERILRGGVPFEPEPGFADAIVARRARVVLEAAQREAGPGRVVIRRPEGRGAQMDEHGEMYEQVGGEE